MRNLVSGVVGVLLGGGIVAYALFGMPRAGGAYGGGQLGGAGFGALMLLAGVYYLVIGIRERSAEPERKPKKGKRKRRQDDDDE